MSNGAGNTGSGEQSDTDDEDCEPTVTGESTRRSPRHTAEDRYATSTEILGFESMNETPNYSDPMAEKESPPSQTVEDAVGVVSRSRSRRITHLPFWLQMNDFPPLLSTLNNNGRPRYDFVKIRENGRLQIQMMPNERPELVASVEPCGRLILRLIKINNGHDQDGQVDDHELEVEGGIQDEEGKVEGGSGDDKEEDKEEKLHGGESISGAH